jgi:hypothetical protein
MRVFATEAALVSDLAMWLEGSGYTVYCEAADLECSIDLAAVKDDLIYLIECKRRGGDYRRCVKQARNHRVIGDYLAVALPRVTESASRFIRESKVGLLMPAETGWQWFYTAERNRSVWKPQQELFRANLSTGAMAP